MYITLQREPKRAKKKKNDKYEDFRGDINVRRCVHGFWYGSSTRRFRNTFWATASYGQS